jgi:exodeoxyribonuclease VII small subunit
MEQIEGIIERIESGEIGLEQSITEYERGAQLLKRCREIVRQAELRVQELSAQMRDSDAPKGADRGGVPAGTGGSGKPGSASADEEGEESPF